MAKAAKKKATTRPTKVARIDAAPNAMFDFGDIVKDAGGAQGAVYSINEFESGTVQYGILPTLKADSPNWGKQLVFDWQDLTLVKKAKPPVPRTPRPELGFGDEVQDKRTDFKGTIVSLHSFRNGCWKYGVQPRELTRDGKRVHPDTIDQNGVILIKSATDTATPPRVGGPERMPFGDYMPGMPV